jgi:hypothetical protein
MSDATNEIPESHASLGRDEILHRFGFHAATIEGPNATAPIHEEIRALFIELAEHLDHLVPAGRGKAAAFTQLQQASMWFHWATAETAPLVTTGYPEPARIKIDEIERSAALRHTQP